MISICFSSSVRGLRMLTARPFASSVVLLSFLYVTACVTDKSADPRLSVVMHHCFRTTGDAVLYHNHTCPPTQGLSGVSACDTLIYLSSFSPPITLGEFNASDRGAATRVQRQIGAHAKDGSELNPVLGTLIKGTPFTVERMRRFSHYEQGDIWIVSAQLSDGPFAGRLVTLPWNDLYLPFHGNGGWINDYVQRDPFVRDAYRLQIDSTKMVSCDISAKAD
jgi:hypothetical protein